MSTIASISTAPGIGGIRIIRMSGEKSFEIMSKKLDIAPQNLVYVGDHPKNDVDASRRAGYIPVWVKTYEWQFDDISRCDYEIDTVADLFEVLDKLNS